MGSLLGMYCALGNGDAGTVDCDVNRPTEFFLDEVEGGVDAVLGCYITYVLDARLSQIGLSGDLIIESARLVIYLAPKLAVVGRYNSIRRQQ